MTRKTLIATLAVLLLGVVAANSAGALGRPWWCYSPQVLGVCEGAHVAKKAADTVNGAAHTAGATADAAGQTGRAASNGVELAGTVIGKTADAIAWANEQAKNARIPSRTLQPGECLETTSGRYCRPMPGVARPHPAPLPVGTCVVDSKGTKWCRR